MSLVAHNCGILTWSTLHFLGTIAGSEVLPWLSLFEPCWYFEGHGETTYHWNKFEITLGLNGSTVHVPLVATYTLPSFSSQKCLGAKLGLPYEGVDTVAVLSQKIYNWEWASRAAGWMPSIWSWVHIPQNCQAQINLAADSLHKNVSAAVVYTFSSLCDASWNWACIWLAHKMAGLSL